MVVSPHRAYIGAMTLIKNLLIPLLLVFSTTAVAAVTPLTQCFIADDTKNVVMGDNVTESYAIASLSKIFTSYWALSVMGPDFRFETKIYVSPATKGAVDVHIEGSQDPFWGRETMHRLVSELQNAGVSKIRNLSFDEDFTLKWSAKGVVISKKTYHNDFSDVPGAAPVFATRADILASLKTNFVPRAGEYATTIADAKLAGVELPASVSVQAPQKILYVSRQDFKAVAGTRVYVMASLPLARQLKIMDLTSNNYLADYFFALLGGPKAFMKFAPSFLDAEDFASLKFVNGSGYPVASGDDKIYNQASCETILRTLQSMRTLLRSQNHDLQDVMAVGGTDASTLDKYKFTPNILIGKTGTVSPAIALAGLAFASGGDFFFAYIMGIDAEKDQDDARAKIKAAVLAAIAEHGGELPIDYSAAAVNLPFDDKSAFASATLNLN